ncbi:hypothetical protein G6F62_013953 [Rhizopus arrhizus]|nr:hypothetical protein G6F62_013953 [Rhizopus arrhizus]
MDGRALMVHLRAASGIDESGRSRVLGTLQDVTEREQSRRLLREREEQFRELVRVLPDGVVILSDEHVLYANAWAASLFGYGSHTLLGEPLSALVAAGDLARVRSQLRAGQPHLGPGHSSVVAMQRADGRSFHAGLARFRAHPQRTGNQQPRAAGDGRPPVLAAGGRAPRDLPRPARRHRPGDHRDQAVGLCGAGRG